MSYFLDSDNNSSDENPNTINPDTFEFVLQKFIRVCPTDRFMILNVLVEDSDGENAVLKSKYVENARNHNQKLLENIDFMDAGFDLMIPYNFDKSGQGVGYTNCYASRVNKLNTRVRCSAQMVIRDVAKKYAVGQYNTGYYMYPRSSISKTCFRLANSVGIIDAGYRGPLIGMVDVVYEMDSVCVHGYDKLFQICAPHLAPVLVNIVDDLGAATSRGEGGFGSTGR
jgi:dUTPase